MLVWILIVLNIPVYLLLAWILFDSKENAADTFFETIVALLKAMLIPRIIRELLGMELEGAWGVFPVLGFLFACGAIVYGEYWLIQKYFMEQPDPVVGLLGLL